MNSLRVCALAFGNDFSDSLSAAVFASVTPPCIFTNVKMLSGCCQCWSKAALEIVTAPNGEPPVGGSKMPLSVRASTSPVGLITVIGEPTVRLWSLA